MSVRTRVRSLNGAQHHKRPIATVAVLGLLAMVLSYLPASVVSATPAQDGNPDLPQRCGLDMTIIIDRSGSIGDYNDDVADAANALIDGVSNTGSKVQVVSFATRATAVTLAGGVGSSSNIGDLRLLPAEDVDLTAYPSSGGTNWDDGLEMVRRQPAVTPLTVILTDGNPTYHNSGSGNDGHGNPVGGTGNTTSATDLSKAVAEADMLKAAGTHILAVGIGDDINGSNLEAISGEEQLTANNNMSFAEADWTTVGFAKLKALLEDFVKELCAPSLNITKTEVPLSGPARSGDGWTFDLALGSNPVKWENPTQSPTDTTASQVTDDGKVNFKWEQGATQNMGATVTEQDRTGWVFESATCQRRNYDTGQVTQLAVTPQTAADGSVTWSIPGGLGPADSVNCDVRNREVSPARIDVRKLTAPANLAGGFDFDLTGNGVTKSLDDLTHGQTQSFGTVAPGTYQVSEDAVANFELTSAVCDNLGTQAVETVGAAALTVAEGEHWLCTFTNTADDGSITVRKVANGANGTFSFFSDFNGDFQLTTSNGAAQSAAVAVAPGKYTVTELDASPWTQQSAVCDDGSPVGDISVAPGEDVICTFTNVAPDPTLSVTKTANVSSVAEPGADVTFTVNITNTSIEAITIDSITDAVDGDTPFDVAGLPVTDCGDLLGDTLAPGASTSCTFTLRVEGNADDVVRDVVKVTGHDSDNNKADDDDDATVTVNDVQPAIAVDKVAQATSVSEPGADVAFTVTVGNPGTEGVTVDSLTDSISGGPAVDISVVGPVVKATTCGSLVGASLAPGESESCMFTVRVSGDGGESVLDVVQVTGSDDDDNNVSDTDEAEVEITDVLPTVTLTKTAGATTVAEPGANVTFYFVIENTSADAVTVTSLTDTVFGDITEQCDLGGDVLAAKDGQPGTGPDSTRCEVTRAVAGNAGDQHHNVATVIVSDDDGNSASAQDDATVDFTDVLPAITVDKDASTATVPEPGAPVEFTATMTNKSVEPVTITAVTDAIGNGVPFDVSTTSPQVLATDCGTALGSVVAPGGTYSCKFTVMVSGNAGASVTDTVRFTAVDDDGNTTTGDDGETVDVDDVLPTVQVTKSASQSEVAEPGADVEFTFTVRNTSVEPVTISTLVDSVFGDVTAECGLAGKVLAPNATADCRITRFIGGNAGDEHHNVAVVTGHDDEGNETTDDDDETVDVDDVLPSIQVTKTASVSEVSEPGADVEFTFTVRNTSVEDVTITSVVDSVFGDVTGECGLSGKVLAAGSTTDCKITRFIGGNAGDLHENTVVVKGTDDDGNTTTDDDDETVDVDDSAPGLELTKTASVSEVSEPGADVEFTFTVRNISVEDVTITSVVDSVFGDVTGECGLSGKVLAAGATTDCKITRFIGGNAGDEHHNVAVVTGHDDEGNETTDDDDETVDVDDVLPSIQVTKTTSVSEVSEPGADVEFTFTVRNTSVEDVTITSLVDSVFGDVTAECGLAGTVLAPNATADCTITRFIGGNAGDVHENTVVVKATDDEGNETTDDDDETVDVDDVLPSIQVTKTASVSEVSEPGADVEFTFTVHNTSVEPVTITSLVDSVFGDVTAECGLAGKVLAAGATTDCKITRFIGGNAGDLHENTVVVNGTDDDGNSATADDDEALDITDVPPSITVTKDDGDASVDAPGGVVTYTVDIANTSVEPVTVTSITDTVNGGDPIDVTTVAAPIKATTCKLGVVIEPGETYRCTFDIEVTGDGSSAVFDVVGATVTDDEKNTTTDTDDEQTPVDPVADLEVDKTVDVGEVRTGAEVTYKLTVRNVGPSRAEEVVVTDELPEGLELVSVDGGEGEDWDCEATKAPKVSCRLLALAAGDTATVTVVAKVDAEPGTIENTVVVDSDTDDPDDTDNTDSVDVKVVTDPVETTTTTVPDPEAPAPRVQTETAVQQPAPGPSASVQQAPLAFTGGNALLIALGGLVVLVAGLVLMAAAQRRRPAVD